MCPTLGVTVPMSHFFHTPKRPVCLYSLFSYRSLHYQVTSLSQTIIFRGDNKRSKVINGTNVARKYRKYKCVPFWTNSGSQVLSYFKGLVLYEIYMDRIFP